MAQRRMLSKQITETDMFMDLPLSSQALYLHLIMNADDDGFLGNAKTILKMVGASNDDFKLLIAKQFIIVFDDGIAVIKDWRIHNYIRKDRYHSTMYVNHKSELTVDESQSYQQVSDGMTFGIPDGNQMDTEVRLGKVRLGKGNKEHSTADAEPLDWQIVIDYLNKKAKKHFKHTDANKRVIMARFKDGDFTVADMKQVIDNQCSKWLNDPQMNQYLRPSTLFQASKFEGYLNNQPSNENQPESREDWFG
ncbi:DNA replication protein [Lactobacillus sp. CBA3605]|uniref:conserved phage C-terminal domain-containing protein n=1 Tax=Lactobacillus sp. CBA3605 TaxID=2099788 RepID=UPI000CFD11F9|nr:conserved phage C-terminal domain-containing protein [Lactobacillus sp. CBA3605]AVK62446.1 DNA replication protein [Lactobacillus sp. CBA3605]